MALSRVISAMNRDRPSVSESTTRIDAPSVSGESRMRAARTGAPMPASTTFAPIARSSVLLPDMFDPLTTSSAGDAATARHARRRVSDDREQPLQRH